MDGTNDAWQISQSDLLETTSMRIKARLSPAAVPQGECVHFWIIEPPKGPISGGVCKLCGKRQEFRNSVYSSAWNKAVARHEDL
ncbi:MAG: hypothetical protein HY531_01995 [Chloroflexi bacterium]|nr:hypothetical protein [Chloroflexota bacterium]